MVEDTGLPQRDEAWQGQIVKGCLVCKTRKVKCDERPGGCLKCERLQIQCPGYDQYVRDRTRAVDEIYQNAGVSKRVIGACRECYASKSRCTKEKPQCARCQKKGVACHYNNTYRGRNATAEPEVEVKTSESANGGSSYGPSPGSNEDPNPLMWLFARNLPQDKQSLKLLVDTYFERIHPLRCLGFVHRPTFVQALERGTIDKEYGDALILIMCALAARTTFSILQNSPLPSIPDRQPGALWAEEAQMLAFKNIGNPSVANLMVLALLCEYNMRHGSHSAVFMLVGHCCRLAQLLRLDQEPAKETISELPLSAQITEAESRRRLMWSCFSLDVIIGSGVEALLLASKSLPNIQLPRQALDFDRQLDLPTAILSPTQLLSTQNLTFTMGLEACFVQIIWLRSQVLRLIRRTEGAEAPWLATSLFMQLLAQIESFGHSIPPHLLFNDINSFIHQEQHQLSAFYLLHLLYHQCYCDLLRITLPGYTFPLAAQFSNSPLGFVDSIRQKAYKNAKVVSSILKRGLQQPINPFDDPLCAACAYEATKIQIIYVATCGAGEYQEWNEVAQDVLANLTVLRLLRSDRDSLAPLLKNLFELLHKFGFGELVTMLRTEGEIDENAEVAPPPQSDTQHLHAASTFRLAWNEISWRKPTVKETEPPRTAVNTPSSMPVAAMLTPTPSATTTSVPYVPEARFFGQQDLLPPEQYLQMADDMQGYLMWDPLVPVTGPEYGHPNLPRQVLQPKY